MTTVISFLGAGNYKQTTYVLGGQAHTTCYMAEAAMHVFQPRPERLLVIATKEAKEAHLESLIALLDGVVKPEPVTIPSGQSEDDQWNIFNAVATKIEPEEELIFDITNGFRSIPVLALLIAAYVRVVRRAKVRHLIYGAFDARDRETNQTPVFDLTPLVALLDWTTATDAFLKYGRADELQSLVMSVSQTADGYGSSSARRLAEQLGRLTAALQTSRPAEVMQRAEQLPGALNAFRASGNLDAATGPLGLLLTQIEREYGRMGHPQPYDPHLSRDVIVKQLEMIEWYASKGLYVQALTLTREWLVSVTLAAASDVYDIYNETDRELAEAAVNGYRETKKRPPRPVPDVIFKAGSQGIIQNLWQRCRQLRNDLAHAGMRHDARSAEDVESEVRQVCNDLRPALRSLGYSV